MLTILRKFFGNMHDQENIDEISRKNTHNPTVYIYIYKEGHRTTEMVFSFKILAEKAITSKQHQVNLLLLDMSKAFDTMERQHLYSRS